MEGVPDARNLKCPARYDLLEKPDRSAAFRLGLAFVAQQGGKRLRFVQATRDFRLCRATAKSPWINVESVVIPRGASRSKKLRKAASACTKDM